MKGIMNFGTLKQIFVKTCYFKEKITPEMYIVEFAKKTKHVNAV